MSEKSLLPFPLIAQGVTKRFRQGSSNVAALNDVSLEVAPGEFVAIMGPSGSGKSTFLHVMAGLTRTNAGTITVDGESLSKLSDAALTNFRRRRIGLVFQQFNLIPTLTALENVMLPLMADGRRSNSDMRSRTLGLFEKLGLSHRAEHRPDSMSGGEQQRVAIARALVTDPAIVLADEPTGSLDSMNGKALCMLLRDLNEQEQRAIILVTHEPAVAAWARRIVVMKDGAVCADFPASDHPDPLALANRYQDIVSGSALEITQ